MENFDTFAELCEEQDVCIHPGILEAGYTNDSGVADSFEPNGLYSAIVCAGRMARREPGIELADSLLKTPDQFLSRVLGNILNASIEPITTATDTTFDPGRTPSIACCDMAETYFADIVEQILLQQPMPPSDPAEPEEIHEYQIIHAPDGRAVAMRKGSGERSTLTLTDFVINGIPYPAGSLMRVDTTDSFNPVSVTYDLKDVDMSEKILVPTTDIAQIGFVRLSAFAQDPVERRQDFGNLWPGRSFNVFAQLTLTGIQSLVQRKANTIRMSQALPSTTYPSVEDL